jgi:hypothetical protein
VNEVQFLALMWLISAVGLTVMFCFGVYVGKQRMLDAVGRAYGREVRDEVELWDDQRAG